MSVMGFHFLQHACAYVAHHTRPTGHGCRDELVAASILYPTSRRDVLALPVNKEAPETGRTARGRDPKE